jgi:hypothetical protein
MDVRGLIMGLAVGGALGVGAAHAQDLSKDPGKYPDWSGQWLRAGSGSFDPSKPPGRGQQAPLTDEYQAILEASLAEIAAGGQGNNPMGRCLPPGLPRTMINYEGMETVITPRTTYILLLEPMDQIRRIYTDGRRWPESIMPAFLGYSIGQWEDTDNDGRYDTLVVETRSVKLPRSYDSSGMPFHKDGQAVIKERLALDKNDANILRDEITIIDHALTRPWTVTRSYRRERNAVWVETVCGEDNRQVRIGNENYYLGADDRLMPTRKDQPPPDLTYFGQTRK